MGFLLESLEGHAEKSVLPPDKRNHWKFKSTGLARFGCCFKSCSQMCGGWLPEVGVPAEAGT